MELLLLIALSLSAGAGTVLVAGGFLALPARIRDAMVPSLVSYATGTLLGGAFLGLIPHALEEEHPQPVFVTVLLGIVLFFILEKLLIWRHCHEGHCAIHDVSGPLILIGDGVHNFVDGLILASTLNGPRELTFAAWIAIVAHEIPQELGDLGVLLGSGYSRRRALILNAISGLATIVGAVGGYAALSAVGPARPYLLAVAAASFIYIAAADLIPGLHRRSAPSSGILQVALLLAGMATIFAVHGHRG